MLKEINWQLVIAFLALAQPWLIKLFSAFFKRAKLEIYETGKIELGFSQFGPTINLAGTLRPINRDIFVSQIQIEIIRKRDSAQHIFKWYAFKNGVIPTIDQTQQIEIASGFHISLNSPKQYNIFFASGTFQEDTNSLTASFIKKWNEIQGNYFDSLTVEKKTIPTTTATKEGLFDNLTKTEESRALFGRLTELFFWMPSDYEVKIIINTSETKQIKTAWKFNITDEESQNIKGNAMAIMRGACGLGHFHTFIYKEYSKSV
ncbi:hypothetical protein [Chromobacterium vaccinii]|uniref:hypothetical protein n=1 Tax=Chromobacterium vaccinii TaxID=1108595 RepID=UPI000A8DAF88|nr:hypothetical protein [Chromobacterium vaccinii]